MLADVSRPPVAPCDSAGICVPSEVASGCIYPYVSKRHRVPIVSAQVSMKVFVQVSFCPLV